MSSAEVDRRFRDRLDDVRSLDDPGAVDRLLGSAIATRGTSTGASAVFGMLHVEPSALALTGDGTGRSRGMIEPSSPPLVIRRFGVLPVPNEYTRGDGGGPPRLLSRF
jgi:hypothetical protein